MEISGAIVGLLVIVVLILIANSYYCYKKANDAEYLANWYAYLVASTAATATAAPAVEPAVPAETEQMRGRYIGNSNPGMFTSPRYTVNRHAAMLRLSQPTF